MGDDADVKFLLTIEGGWVGQGLVADFVEGIGAVGDEFSKKDFLV